MGGATFSRQDETLFGALLEAIRVIERGYNLGLTEIREFRIWPPTADCEYWKVEWNQHA